ncbi:hypothetical protein TWF696_004278 [Orbilia brochopaga]|uniref:IgE-binding protein n=1 Tax=Orbilia brochopaga TaxID=3140254 RepID=A0AAV9V5X0_9PEZI
MQFTIATILATIAAVSAAPTPAPEAQAYTLMAIRSASPIHYGSLQASGQKFYIGLDKPSSYCPSPPVDPKACPSGKATSIAWGESGPYMNVMVPGGQRLYIAPDRSLSYTQAHSAFIPDGSITDGFTRGEKQENTLTPISHGSDAFLACPTKQGAGPYQIFVGQPTDAAVPSGKASDCIPFAAEGVEFTGERFGAWQY